MLPPLPPPPPVTPSPHRFVIKRPTRAPPSHRPPSISSSQQFNTTPRFSFAASQRSAVTNAFNLEATPSPRHFATPARPAARPQDSIEDGPDEADLDAYESVEFTNPDSDQQYHSGEEDDDYGLTARNPKRRRLSASPILDSPSADIPPEPGPHQDEDIQIPNDDEDFEDLLSSANTIASPPASAHHRPNTTAAPRFLLHHHPTTPAPDRGQTPRPAPTPAGTSTGPPFAKPPRFRPPDEQSGAPRPAEPLPEMFSPHRRGPKFLAGGLAAEVRGWVMDIENSLSGPASASASGLGGQGMRSQKEGQREEGWVVRMLVEGVKGGAGAGVGMTLARGRRVVRVRNSARLESLGEGGEEEAGGRREGEDVVDYLSVMKIILVGSGLTEGLQQASRVEEGKMIRINQPVWEVVLDGERWGVAVTWDVNP